MDSASGEDLVARCSGEDTDIYLQSKQDELSSVEALRCCKPGACCLRCVHQRALCPCFCGERNRPNPHLLSQEQSTGCESECSSTQGWLVQARSTLSQRLQSSSTVDVSEGASYSTVSLGAETSKDKSAALLPSSPSANQHLSPEAHYISPGCLLVLISHSNNWLVWTLFDSLGSCPSTGCLRMDASPKAHSETQLLHQHDLQCGFS
ncbi:uncharacterized protein LOC104865446 [Fukomys damarensis]|uniref:uncharacterized protein LOC104865446 n=1 Tax=Fukomys damarensis TaxID=885580 RepID=UPI000540279C|nr:uncharacterized protein LOC104865446 [Fukomys damarensis]